MHDGPEVVHDSDYYRIDHFVSLRVVVVTRKAKPFEDRHDVEAACGPVQSNLDRLVRANKRLLIDSRQAPMRNDPQSEANFAPHRRKMSEGFERVAVVLRTQVGQLQTQRLIADIKPLSTPLRTFLEMTDALAYLTG
ncbi:MAG: hypothetical protein WKG00_32000 [Polyangiaceae bacterium]